VRDARFEPLVRSLLANVVIVNDLDAALALRATNPGFSVATLRGELVDEHGILSAVSASQIVEVGTLSDEISGLQARAADLATCKSELEQKKAGIEAAVAQSRAELHDKEVTLAAKQGEGNALGTERRDLESKVHTVVFELTGIEQQDSEDKARRAELFSVLQQTDARLGQLHEEQNVAQRVANELQTQKEQLTQQLTEQRVAVGGVEHKRGSIRGQLEPISGRVRDLRERMQTCASEIDSHTTRIEQLRQEITESEQKVVELGASREQSQQQLAGLQHQRGEVATGIQHAEDELRAIRKQAAEAQERKSGFDVALAQKRMEMQNLKDHVWQKYQANLDEIHGDTITITVADQGASVSQQVPLETDWDAIEQQVAEMQSKLDAMGPVNVEAINEYDELEQRYTFLTQQHDDLVKAKEQLLQVIAKINTTTKQLFSETFEKVRVNFQAMFVELFGGGKANLLLIDESDPLESGIEIVAKPPGKQLQSITLLSGGEKTLTATALLFSIYMVKPSPFCVLDELDAPLDESNINRFIRILQRFITQSQFVIITHSKRTIGMADALYGITMQEHGISKVVSVKFSPHDETARKDHEKRREKQEDLIDHDQSATDNAATVAGGLRPHEEPIRNDLLNEKEGKLAPVTDTTPIDAPEPALGQRAPDSLKAEVRAAVDAAEEASESVKQSVAEASDANPDKPA
jgi:chromosome segregation protein